MLENLKKISKQTLEEIDIKDIQKEKKILKKLNSIKIEKFHQEFKIVFQKYQNSMICNIFDRFFKLILPYNKILENEEVNEILEKQICELLSSFNSIFDRINIKI